MSTTADFIGRNCPLCNAVDSLETDDTLGEVACTECAKVVVMGLEENLQTRFLKDATFDDADRHASTDPSASAVWSQATGSMVSSMTRHEAAAAVHRQASSPAASASPAALEYQYRNTPLPRRLTQHIEILCRLSRRPLENLRERSVALAKHFLGSRLARNEKVGNPLETAAACFMLAAEQIGSPVPMAELRIMDPDIKDIEVRRLDIIEETKRTKEFNHLRTMYPINLTRYYIRLLKVQRSVYEVPCLALNEVLQSFVSTHTDLAQFVEADRVVAAILLAYTEPRIHWPDHPTSILPEGHPRSSIYEGFASNANLPPGRVAKVMDVVTSLLPKIQTAFPQVFERMSSSKLSPLNGHSDTTKDEPTPGTKRERSD